MKSKLAIAGHPLHPMLVTVPVGLFVWAFVADIVYLATDKDRMWYDISFWSGVAAIVTALVAAVAGLVDYLTVAVRTEARGMATAHMLLNVTVVALYFIAMLLMRDGGALEGGNLTLVVALHAIGAGLLSASGWIGGEMSYRHHLAIIPDDGELEAAENRRHLVSGELRGGFRMR
ncbi:MAG TPA: DUF2231 domain-containing protein [Dehalococcoidia bacterium]|nr:DUF2231 domain-containing protein [Dehalococcoidia bacterium]